MELRRLNKSVEAARALPITQTARPDFAQWNAACRRRAPWMAPPAAGRLPAICGGATAVTSATRASCFLLARVALVPLHGLAACVRTFQKRDRRGRLFAGAGRAERSRARAGVLGLCCVDFQKCDRCRDFGPCTGRAGCGRARVCVVCWLSKVRQARGLWSLRRSR